MVQWWQRDGMMVRWWKRDGAMVKKQRLNGERAIVRLWNNEGSMMKTWWYFGERRCYDGENTMIRYDETAIAWWWKRNIFFSIVTSDHRDFTIVPSCFNHRTIVPSQFHLCVIVHSFSGRQKMLLVSKQNTVIGWYWMIQYRNSFCISPKSRVSLRISFVDVRQENCSRSYTAK
jgi:hypothetical protein